MKEKKQVILIVLDGWGYREEKKDNAIAEADTPYFDYLWQNYPHTILEASGEAVGLPEGQSGGSEIGHLAIGAGKPIKSDLVRINQSIKDGSFHKNAAFNQVFDHVKKYYSCLHIVGLLGPSGVHAHHDHMYEILKTAKEAGIKKIALHPFTDGRDRPPQESSRYLEELENLLGDLELGFIATISGRYYAMDRDHNWDRFEKVEKTIFQNISTRRTGKKASDYLRELYENGESDELLEPVVFLDNNAKSYKIEKNDGVIHTNFRADRGRMFSKKLLEKKNDMNLFYVTMTEYDKTYDCAVAFPPENIEATLSGEISKANLKQFHTAETEKYAHATYFLNGGIEKPFPGESRIMIESRKDIRTPDEAPALRAKEVADITIKNIHNEIDFIFVNFANTDLLGHTAKKKEIIEAVQEIDKQLQRIIDIVIKKGSVAFITSDHGNAELNIHPNTGEPHTSHTENPVPGILVGSNVRKIKEKGSLIDIAPTILSIFGIKKPTSMTGNNLISEEN